MINRCSKIGLKTNHAIKKNLPCQYQTKKDKNPDVT